MTLVRTNLLFLSVMLCFCYVNAQNQAKINGKELLQKTIAYHDPKGNWGSFQQKLYFHAKEVQDTAIYEEVFLDNKNSFFGHISHTDGKLIEKGVQDTFYFARINGDTSISADDKKKYRVSKRATRAARNSYVFLYGLPMKMADKGVILTDEVKIDTFNKKNYYVLRADFEKGIGTDTWYLYINPENYAMEGYRFYHNRKPNDGEFIICEGLLNVQEMKIPKIRYWYSNANGEYGATDIVERIEKWTWKKKKGTQLK